MPGLEELRLGLEAAGQAHVLRFWSELGPAERDTFLQELSQLDLDRLRESCEAAREAAALDRDQDRDMDMEPIPAQYIGSVRSSDSSALAQWQDRGSIHLVHHKLSTTKFPVVQKSQQGCACVVFLSVLN